MRVYGLYYFIKVKNMPNTKEKNNIEELLYLCESIPIKLSELIVNGNTQISEVQIAREGTFKRLYGKKLILNEQVFDELIENFKNNVLGTQPHCNSEHMINPDGVLGWSLDLYKKYNNGKFELWCKTEWNSLGIKAITDKRFKYCSIEFYPEYTNPETGEKYKNVFCGFALTASPFITNMETVSLSREKISFDVLTSEDNEDEVNLDKLSNNNNKIKKEVIELPNEAEKVLLKETDVSKEVLSFLQDKFKMTPEQMLALKSEHDKAKEELSTKEKELSAKEEILNKTKEELSKKDEILISEKKKLEEIEKQMLSVKEEKVNAEVDSLMGKWILNKEGEGLVKKDVEEKLKSFVTTLSKMDSGLITLSNESEFKLTEKFVEIMDSIPKTKIDLSVSGFNEGEGKSEISLDDAKKKLNVKGDDLKNSSLEEFKEADKKVDLSIKKYMEENKIDSYSEAMDKMIEKNLL